MLEDIALDPLHFCQCWNGVLHARFSRAERAEAVLGDVESRRLFSERRIFFVAAHGFIDSCGPGGCLPAPLASLVATAESEFIWMMENPPEISGRTLAAGNLNAHR